MFFLMRDAVSAAAGGSTYDNQRPLLPLAARSDFALMEDGYYSPVAAGAAHMA